VAGLHRAAAAAAIALLLACSGGLTVIGASELGNQPEHGAAPAGDHAAPPGDHAQPGEHGAAEAHGESLVSFLSRIANFLILAGGLYYLLRAPVRRYLDARSEQIRGDLETAAATRARATRSLEELESQLAKLPAELEALKTRGKDEIAAEQVRIAQTAEAERARLLDQTRREIDRQLQIARRELTEHAADLAVGVARTRLAREMTAADQLRLVDRYVGELGGRRE
jgi:F-type H+-transporting ATPase subunit b